MTPTGRNKNIDNILSLFDLKIEISEKEVEEAVDKSETEHTILQMNSIGLIKIFDGLGKRSFMLKSFGIEVKQHGSWTKYLSDKDEEQKANRQLIKSSIRTNWMQRWLLIATSVFSLLALCVSTADIIIHRKELRVANEELRLHKLEVEQQKHNQQSSVHSDSQNNPKSDSTGQKIRDTKK